MKTIWVTAHDNYYPGGGFYDIKAYFAPEELEAAIAEAEAFSRGFDWVDIVDVTPLLNGTGLQTVLAKWKRGILETRG